MKRDTRKADAEQSVSETKSVLEEVLRQGTREMLLKAIEAEVGGYIDQHSHLRDEAGPRLVVRNGYMPEREILTGIGPVPIRQPRTFASMLEENIFSKVWNPAEPRGFSQ